MNPSRSNVSESVLSYLRTIDTNEVQRRIRTFKKLSMKVETREEVVQELYKIFMPGGVGRMSLPTYGWRYEPGCKFYRCRIIKDIEDISEPKDVWEAPAVHVPPGRLNVKTEPLLYVAIDSPSTAAYEVGLEVGKIFAVTTYKVVDLVTLARIEKGLTDPGYRMSDQRKLDLLLGFLAAEFNNKDAGTGEYAYRVPEVIAKELFTWPTELFQGWRYKSVASPLTESMNACFLPAEAKTKLEISRVFIGTCTKIDDAGHHFELNRILEPNTRGNSLEILWDSEASGSREMILPKSSVAPEFLGT